MCVLYIYIYNNLVIELYTSCAQVLELPQSHFGNNQEAHLAFARFEQFVYRV